MIINLFIPILLIYIISKNLQILLKREFIQSLFFTNIFIIFYYYLILKINFFWIGNYILIFLTFFISIITLKKNKKIFLNFKDFSIIILICFFIYLICKNFYLYKYDEFSEYGIITKLTFFLDTLPINSSNILYKGSYYKINLLSSYHIFFLKNSFVDFNETILIFSNIFFIIILILVILSELKNLNFSNKIIFFFIIIIITYMLNSGLDRIYPETIIALLISNILILTDKLNNKFNKLDFVIVISCLLLIFGTKQSGMIIFILINSLIIFNFLILKKYLQVLILTFTFIFCYFLVNFHITPINFSYNLKVHENYEVYKINENIGTVPGSIISNIKNQKITFANIANSIYLSNTKESIYHLYSLSNLEKIFKLFKIEQEIIKIPLNFIFWFSIIFFLYFVDKKTFLRKNYYYLFFIIVCFFSYQIIITIWAYNNNLVHENGQLILSWSRHNGILLSGFLIFYILNTYTFYKEYRKYILFTLIFFIIIFMPARTFRGIIPNNIENKIPYWNSKKATRMEIKNLSDEIKKIVPAGKTIFYFSNQKIDPYFFPILNYELISNTLIIINELSLNQILNSDTSNYLLINDEKFKNLKINHFKNYTNNKFHILKTN